MVAEVCGGSAVVGFVACVDDALLSDEAADDLLVDDADEPDPDLPVVVVVVVEEVLLVLE